MSEGKQFPIDQVTLTADHEFIDETWTAKDEMDFHRVTGLTLYEWVEMAREYPLKGMGGLYLSAICWIENRRKWPDLTFDAVAEIPYGKMTDLAKAGGAEEQEVEVPDDSPLEEQSS